MSRMILVADSDTTSREVLQEELCKYGFKCEGVDSARGVLVKVGNKRIGLAIFDLSLPDMDGIELFKSLIQVSPKTSVIIATDHATLKTSIEALRLGAVDYLVKPLDLEELIIKVKRLFDHKDFVNRAQFLHQQLNLQYDCSNVLARSRAMKRVLDLIQRVSLTDINVLITGKSGTGKELVARAIHHNSPRKQHQFVTINCGAISESLFESELFGHKKGAFTNAIKNKDGLFKIASGGTIFFDEISCLSLAVQAKLLRAVEFGQIVPVGATEPIDVDVRFIASTNKNLEAMVKHGQFREDLYYRLHVFEIHVPSLKERKEDIPLLAQHFVGKFAREMNKQVAGITPDALEILLNAKWQGEVRELENAIERAMIFCEGDMLSGSDLRSHREGDHEDCFELNYHKTMREAVQDFERHFILTNLKHNEGHRLRAFKAMGMSESSFYRKIVELGIKDQLPPRQQQIHL